jgi:hypothetical protein
MLWLTLGLFALFIFAVCRGEQIAAWWVLRRNTDLAYLRYLAYTYESTAPGARALKRAAARRLHRLGREL